MADKKLQTRGRPKGSKTKKKGPPRDAIAGAAWLYHRLQDVFLEVLEDKDMDAVERAKLIVQLGGKITAATPNLEIYDARQSMVADESDQKIKRLDGKVNKRVPAKRARLTPTEAD